MHIVGLLITLAVLIILSAFFSGSETSMMSLNRYKLRHLAKHNNKAAQRSQTLLSRPDRLLGVILIGSTVTNIIASAIATVIAGKLFGDIGIAIGTAILALVILIFAEVLPKTFAAIYPEKCAFPASWPLKILLRAIYPFVMLANGIVNNILKLFGIKVDIKRADPLSMDELRTVVHASSAKITQKHRHMLLGILDLEKITLDEILIPRHNVFGLNLNDDWKTIIQHIKTSPYSRVPVYRDNLDNVMGILHLKKAIWLTENNADQSALEKLCDPPYFIPETTSLQKQIQNFQTSRQNIGIVVDEYGDIKGIVTIEDIVEEIVGHFTDVSQPSVREDIQELKDGSYLVDAEVSIRDLNRELHFHLPTDGPTTLAGLVLEHLEDIPNEGITVLIDHYPIEIVEVLDNTIKNVKIHSRIKLDAIYHEHE